MKAIILAAGYGTRLEESLAALKIKNSKEYDRIKPFIEGKAKPMVLIAGKPLVQYLVENMARVKSLAVDEVIVVTNNKYFGQFEAWKKNYNSPLPLRIMNDGTDSNDERLGAVNDLLLVLKQERISEAVLVVSGDNLLTFELEEQVALFCKKKSSILLAYRMPKAEKRSKSARIGVDENFKVIHFEEKQKKPKSDLICPAVYVFSKEAVKQMMKMIIPDDKKDLIGNIPSMLYQELPFYALVKNEKVRFDLGSVEEFEKADEYFRIRKRNSGDLTKAESFWHTKILKGFLLERSEHPP